MLQALPDLSHAANYRIARDATPVAVGVLSDGSAFHDGAHLTREQTAALRHAETVEAVRRLGLPAGALRWYGYRDGAPQAHDAELTGVVRELMKCHAIAARDSQPDRPPTVPPRAVWSLLPPEIRSQARRSVELFLPWPR
jgi:LmbE family N-acetylglucosaminyl deacetylase